MTRALSRILAGFENDVKTKKAPYEGLRMEVVNPGKGARAVLDVQMKLPLLPGTGSEE